jgi:ribosomal protein S18 acetylase RimI-like enzyme
MMSVTIRNADLRDAAAVARLADEFHAYLNALGDPALFNFTAEIYVRDGFGDDPAFYGLVAESGGSVVGYLLLHFGYDTDRGRREAYVDDVYVQAKSRGQGIGKALMSEAAGLARSRGAKVLWWGVYERNEAAFRFYESIGARYLTGIRFMYMDI